jgi:hypothetical protein
MGVGLVSVWFFTLSYLAFAETKFFADEMQLSYSKFHTWSAKRIPVKLPSPQIILPWKLKISMLLGYLWIVLTLGTLLGVRQASYLLLLLHVLYTVIYDNPALTHTTGTYENKVRACLFDGIIACTLLMIGSWDDISAAPTEKIEEES